MSLAGTSAQAGRERNALQATKAVVEGERGNLQPEDSSERGPKRKNIKKKHTAHAYGATESPAQWMGILKNLEKYCSEQGSWISSGIFVCVIPFVLSLALPVVRVRPWKFTRCDARQCSAASVVS